MSLIIDMLVGPDGLATPNNPDTGSDEIGTFGIVYWEERLTVLCKLDKQNDDHHCLIDRLPY
jgi:hypothetical protein